MEKKTDKPSKVRRYKRLFVALSVIFIIICGFVLYLSWPLLTGKTVILKTHPIDPFDIFRGQYIHINYEISSIPILEGAKEGDTIYVIIKEGENKIWNYAGASLQKPKSNTFIKGSINLIRSDQMSVEYGIEQYFFQRGATFPQSNLSIEVKISKSGSARISRLLADGKPLQIEYPKISITS